MAGLESDQLASNWEDGLNTASTKRSIAVVKVGGSLFDLPDLRERLMAVFDQLSTCQIAIVSGGGASANIVRELQPIHGLTDAEAHRVALRSMSVGESLLNELVGCSALAESRTAADQCGHRGRIAIIQAAKFVRTEHAANQSPLEENWSVTSDSIAAWVTVAMQATRLIMLKSVDADSWEQAVRHTDSCFGQHAETVPQVSWCNLRRTTELTELR